MTSRTEIGRQHIVSRLRGDALFDLLQAQICRVALFFLSVCLFISRACYLWPSLGPTLTLYNSGFMDDVIFAHKPRLLDVAGHLKRSAHSALGLATNCAQ